MHEKFGTIESFEKTSNGVRMFFTRDGRLESADAAVVVLAVDGSPTLLVWPLAMQALRPIHEAMYKLMLTFGPLRRTSLLLATLPGVSCSCRRRFRMASSLRPMPFSVLRPRVEIKLAQSAASPILSTLRLA